jgi:two-component system, sensor histidine kinase
MLRVMVADDVPVNADSMCDLLTMLGHEARAFYDSDSLLAAAEQFRPHAILLDLGMPTVDGYETCRLLRARPATAGATIIALTGWGGQETQQATHLAGFDMHLVKPVDFAELTATLAAIERATE